MAAKQRTGVQLFGTGRILLWRGGSVWIGYAGKTTDFHSHHAIQITVTLSGGEVRFRLPGQEWKAYEAAVVAAHQSHAFEADDELVALVFIEPESREGRAIRERFRKGIAPLSDKAIQSDVAAIATAYNEKGADHELIGSACAMISSLAATSPLPAIPLDKRILRATELLPDCLGQPIYLADIADAVHLSPDRFRHLFIEQTGIRFRPYVLWLRLGNSISSHAAGASLTEAAYAGGFADSAHFSRTFKKMFGIAPASVQLE